MSRHVLTPLPGREQHKIVVGWDPPLNTFFAQVHDKIADEEQSVLLWIGASPSEIHDHEKVIAAVRPYAVIPPTLAGELYGEAND